MDSATLEPASALPVIATVCSAALTMLSPATASISGASGTPVSSRKDRPLLAAPTLPATSITTAVSVFCPSLPRSAAATAMSTNPAAMSLGLKVTSLRAAKEAPFSSSSTWSPCTAREPTCGSATRNSVLAASAAFMRPSSRSWLLPCSDSVGAAGASVSSTKLTGALAEPRLPATSTITADRLLEPSAPSAEAGTVKSTTPACRSPAARTFGVAMTEPPSSSSTRSPTTALDPAVGSVTRKVVLTASAAFMRSSSRSSLPCSARVGDAGATVSIVIVRVAGLETLPAASAAVTEIASLPWPMAFRSACVRA